MSLPLPYPNMDFTPLDTLTAAEMNQIVANAEALISYINSLASGLAINNGAITSEKIADNAVTTSKIRFDSPTTDSNGWKKIKLSDEVIIYMSKGSTSITCPGGSWRDTTLINKPSDLDVSHNFFGAGSAKANDNAINTSICVNKDSGNVFLQMQNEYGNSITTSCIWSAIIIELI